MATKFKGNWYVAAVAGILLASNFLLSGCFSVMGAMGQAWSGSQGPKAKRDALIADVVTLPVQAPLIAGVTVLALPELLKGDDSNRPIDGVTVIRLRAVDDEGMPLAGARARVGYEGVNLRRNPDGLSEGPSNNEGFFPRPIKASIMAYGGFQAAKEGHYAIYVTRGGQLLRPKEGPPGEITLNVTLKRIRNPVPMYAKRVEVKVPEFNQPIGYDLIQGDLVAPYGKGQISDLIFEADRKVVSDEDYDGTLTLRFSNEGDGLVAHEIPRPDPPGLRMPYSAPDDGYVSSKTWEESRHTSGRGNGKIISTASNRMNYFIRVRTVRDNNGKIVSALYGKIHGDFRWFIGAHAPKSGLAFTYYLNPDGTRNIEYDPKRNLLMSAKRDDSDYENLAP
jgi:hypothetical protein